MLNTPIEELLISKNSWHVNISLENVYNIYIITDLIVDIKDSFLDFLINFLGSVDEGLWQNRCKCLMLANDSHNKIANSDIDEN